MDGPHLLLVLVALGGSLMALRPCETARFEERVDAFGSDREPDLGSVEPTPQNVLVFRAFGAATFVVGVAFLLWTLGR